MTVEGEDDPKKIWPSSSSSSQTTEDFISTLPPEIIVDILLRLPVESLIRCRCVCKAWLSLVSDPKFVKSHLNLSVRSDDHACHRLIYSPDISLKSCSVSNLLRDKSVDAVELDCPLKSYNSVSIVGSCNGLICVTNDQGIVYIWNPVTRQSDRLPSGGVKWRTGGLYYYFYGFGYVESNDDYKVVDMFGMQNCGDGFTPAVKVYSMKTRNWKRIGEFPSGSCGSYSNIPLNSCGTYLNGALYWVASKCFCWWRIVSLDLIKETYDEVPQPVCGKSGRNYLPMLGVLGDWLSVMYNYDGTHVDVWVMKEYGVKESWIKLVSIPYLLGLGSHRYSVPLCISNDGKFLLKLGCKLFLYDPKDKHIKEIQNIDPYFRGYTYVESLVAPAPAR